MSNRARETLIERLEEAGLSTRRFLKVHNDKRAFEKGCLDLDKLYTPENLPGYPRWGVAGGRGLVPIDTDKEEMAEILREIFPPTFETISPRRQLPHFYYKVDDGEVDHLTLSLKGDNEGAGEIRTRGYLVAPGTTIRYVDKVTGEEQEGKYKILHDRPIAKVRWTDFINAVAPYLGVDPAQKLTQKEMREGVSQGHRHDRAVRYATYLVGTLELDRETALQHITDWDRKHNNPPINDDSYFERTIDSAIRFVLRKRKEKEKDATPRAAETQQPAKEEKVEGNGAKYFIDKTFVPKWLADDICINHHFITHKKSFVIYHYDNGVYVPNGETVIRELAREYLGSRAKDRCVFETIKQIQDTTFRDEESFVAPLNLVCLENGILDLDTLELQPHTPDIIFLNKISVRYDPSATAPVCGKYLQSWMKNDDIVRFVQFLGFCLYRNYSIRKVLLLCGEGGNGKTTCMSFISLWLGEDNISNIPVQNLDNNRFSAAALLGKLANVCDDLPQAKWFQTGRFKLLSGGGPVDGEVKFKNPFSFRSYAKMAFSANRLPLVTDETVAFWDRILLVSFPHVFKGKNNEAREKILSKILTDEEKSGILNAALAGLKMLQDEGDFFKPEAIDAVRSKYIHFSDPVAGFAADCIVEDVDGIISKDDLYQEYVDYCREHNFGPVMNSVFSKMLKIVVPSIRGGRSSLEGARTTVWYGVRIKTEDERSADEVQLTLNDSGRGVRGVRDIFHLSIAKILYIYRSKKNHDTPGRKGKKPRAQKPGRGKKKSGSTLTNLEKFTQKRQFVRNMSNELESKNSNPNNRYAQIVTFYGDHFNLIIDEAQAEVKKIITKDKIPIPIPPEVNNA